MFGPFHRFVAWRYLMARPRKLSRPLLALAGVFLVLGLIALAVGELVLERGDPQRLIAAHPMRQGFLLSSVGLFAVAEFWLVVLCIRYFFSFFTTVSIAGVYIGSMALVVVLSVMGGFETDLRTKILGSNAHVLVTKEEGAFTDYAEVMAAIAEVPGVVAQTPYAVSEVVIAANSNYSNVIIKGIDPLTIGAVTELGKNVKQPRALEALWPLSPEGDIIGPPSSTGTPEPAHAASAVGDVVDPVPEDFAASNRMPTDYSGDSNEPGGQEALDPAPGDFAVADGEPLDFSADASAGEEPAELAPDEEAGFDDAFEDDAFEENDGREAPPLVDADALEGPSELEGPPPAPRIPERVAALSGVLVGRELVKHLHLYVGQEVRMVSPLSDPKNPGAAPVPYTRNYRVAGTFYTGMYEYDLKFVYVALESLQEFLDLGDQVNGIEIRVANPEITEPVLRRLRARLGAGFRVQDWKELNRNLFSALKLEKIAMFLVLAIIILVASFSIIGNLIMVVVEKAKEIALLKTLGSSSGSVLQVFIAQGFIIGLVGSAIGIGHGLLACGLGLAFGLPLNPDVYYIDRLPIAVEWSSVVAIAAAGLVISVIATLYPAYVGARLRPVEGLRYE